MSDLIDFEGPNAASNNSLASPLIPAPEPATRTPAPEAASSSSTSCGSSSSAGCTAGAASPDFGEKRRSTDNNPFDLVMRKITDYERNREDPFERVIEKAKGQERRSNMLRTVEEPPPAADVTQDISIITDLNNTNLIGDAAADGSQVAASWGCDDTRTVPGISVQACDADLSILNTSAMNDSWLGDSDKGRPRCLSQTTFASPKVKDRRSVSVSTAPRDSVFGDASVRSSMFEDPLNNAFRQISLRSSDSSCQFDASTSRQKDRLNSDSSVFSGLSNISAIQVDPRLKQERLCSESSLFSNISIIPAGTNSSSSYDSSVFSNETANKGFMASRLQLGSGSFGGAEKTPGSAAADKSDLIKKFYEIKTRMSTSRMSTSRMEVMADGDKRNGSGKSEEKLIDVDDDSCDSAFNVSCYLKFIICISSF